MGIASREEHIAGKIAAKRRAKQKSPVLVGHRLFARLANNTITVVVRPSDPGRLLTPVVMVLAAHTKQFKDSNFNVLKASFLGITTLLEAAHAAGVAKGNQAVVSTVVAPAVEKLGDRKLQVNKAVSYPVHNTPVFRSSFFLSSSFLLTHGVYKREHSFVLWLP